MADLEKRGYYVVRSAGSHSAIDIVALAQQVTLGVQAKMDGRVDPEEWDALWDLVAAQMLDQALIASVGPKRGQIVYGRITGPKGIGHRGLKPPCVVYEP
jgi:hypothetical protein